MKLSSLETIESLEPIENADAIVMATVLGWNIIVKKDEFQIGDRCIHIPVDTIIDTSMKHFERFRKDDKCKPMRVQTRKIRGVYSEGIVLPLDEFTEIDDFDKFLDIEDYDFGETLGVTKYEKTEVLDQFVSEKKKLFPPFPSHIIPKTDEDSLRTKKRVLEDLIDKEIYVSQKQDGSSMTMIWKTVDEENVFILSKRNITVWKTVNGEDEYIFTDPMVDYVKKYNLHLLFVGRNIAIQGEFCGPKINGNKLKLTKFMWYVFTVLKLDEDLYMSLNELEEFTSENKLDLVPIIDRFTLIKCDKPIELFQEFANDVKYGKNNGEGIVIRPVEPIYSICLRKNISLKIINQNYKD